jgi:hypothetical protein
MQDDYYSVLASAVRSARENPQLRTMIYELARSKLRERLEQRRKALSQAERARQLLALENAIEQLEAELAERVSGNPAGYPVIEIIPPARDQTRLSEVRSALTSPRSAPVAPPLIRSALMLAATAILGVVTYVALQHGLSWKTREDEQRILTDTTQAPDRPIGPALPIPTAYGVYALTDGRLSELHPLPIRVPTAGVAISATISSPSITKLLTGRPQFIVFERDLVKNVPGQIATRVVARVRHGSTFADADGEAFWVVRGISYKMKVAPVDGNPAMILIHSADPGFSLPAGRYALVLNTVGYDFSVDGPITDLAQCVEFLDAKHEYIECGAPL